MNYGSHNITHSNVVVTLLRYSDIHINTILMLNKNTNSKYLRIQKISEEYIECGD